MTEPDLFIFFRTLLFLFLGAYSLLLLASGLWRLRLLLSGPQTPRQLLRLYLSYQLLTIRLRPLRGELLQIGLWTLMLCLVWWLHTLV